MTAENLKTWANSQEEEDAMDADHLHLWKRMIQLIEEKDLQNKDILDYGCNQGGFLRLLYSQRPFKSAVGVDIAQDSLNVAAEKSTGIPAEFKPAADLANIISSFDMAFSHEVLYLLPDMKKHAEQIKQCLKPGGVYYAAIGCHTDNPQWDRWVDLIGSYSNIDVQNYSLDDYADAFFDAGFKVSATPYKFEGFVPLKYNNSYFPKVRDSLDYHNVQKTLFRFVKEA